MWSFPEIREGLALTETTYIMSELSPSSYMKLVDPALASSQPPPSHSATGELTLEHERALVSQVLAGNEAAFDEFYRHYVPTLFRYIYYSFNGNREDAEDILQETVLAAVRSLHRFRGQSSLHTWLHAIARHKISDQIRKRQRADSHQSDEEYHEPELREPGAQPDDLVSQRGVIEAALSALPQDHREVLLGKYLEGFSVRELAYIMGRSEKSVESLLTRARAAFRVCVENITSEGS